LRADQYPEFFVLYLERPAAQKCAVACSRAGRGHCHRFRSLPSLRAAPSAVQPVPHPFRAGCGKGGKPSHSRCAESLTCRQDARSRSKPARRVRLPCERHYRLATMVRAAIESMFLFRQECYCAFRR
jgi:hypothetical protein